MKKYYILSFFSLVIVCSIQAQKSDSLESIYKTHHKHGIGLSFSLTNIPVADEDNTPFAVWAPTIGIEYGHRINRYWDIGILSDLELISYEINVHYESDQLKLIRENAWVTILTFFYHPNEHIRLFFGPGIEIEKHKNFFVTSIGFGYHMHKKKLTAMPFFKVDLKGFYYTTAFGITLGTRF